MLWKKEIKKEKPLLFECDREMEDLCKKAEEYKELKRITKDANFFRYIADCIEQGKISCESYNLEWGESGILTIELLNQPEVSKILPSLFYDIKE